MSGSPLAATDPPPALGQDSARVLAGLGLNQDQMQELAGRGVVKLA